MSVKTKAEEQVALAMMMMAGGEGTSAASDEVGVKTRSSSSRRASLQQQQQSINLSGPSRRGRTSEPVSGNYLNKNKTRRNHDQTDLAPGTQDEDQDNSYQDEDNDTTTNGDEDEGRLVIDQSDKEKESATDLVIKHEAPDEAIVCTVNPLSIQSSGSPASPEGSQQSTNSGSGGSSGAAGGGANGTNAAGLSNDCVYMSASRRIFRPEFKQRVMDAFSNDPDCVGNQRATARKFGIHRRQVQKWLQQLSTGELTFNKDLPPQDQGDNEDSHLEASELTSRKVAPQLRSAHGKPSRNPNGKIVARRGVGNPIRQNPSQTLRANANISGKASIQNRGNKGVSLKVHKSATPYIPSLAVTPNTSGSSMINVSKGGKGKYYKAGSVKPTASSSGRNYKDSNGESDAETNNMFMNMSTLMASAAAAGSLSMPLALDNNRHFSPRHHSPTNNNERNSPPHNGGGGNNGSLHNALILVDELNLLYPCSDFSLLRNALLKEEVSLEKLKFVNKSNEFRVNGNGLNSDLTQSLSNFRRAAFSPSPAKSREDYSPQQTLEMLQNHQQYIRLLQQCGNSNNAGDLTGGLTLADLINNGRLPAWFNPFAAANAMSIPSTSKFGSGNSMNVGNDNNSRRSNPGKHQENTDNHRFAPPRLPPAVNSNKAKTVAAALAATRVQSASSQQQNFGARNYSNQQQSTSHGQPQRNSQRRKGASNSRIASTRGSHHQVEDDMIDPTSMLEVVTNIPSPAQSPATSDQYQQRNSGYTNDYQQGMDLSTSAPSASATSSNRKPTATRLVSKAMNKEYSFLNVLGLVRKSPEETMIPGPSSSSSDKNSNSGYGLTQTLENFVETILPPRQNSPRVASSSTSSSSPPASDLSDSERIKSMVIDAFSYDTELSGDARAVARKFGLNARVVMKWLKEASTRTPPQTIENGLENTNGPVNGVDGSDEDDSIHPQMHDIQRTMINESNNNSTSGGAVNKRKNSKPNQICDFTSEDDAVSNGALDMVVPIKKRRVSSPSPTL